MENKKLAQVAAHLDETQIVSLEDLEELERLQLAGSHETETASRRRSVPLGAVLGVLLALLLISVLAVGYVIHQRSAAQPAQNGSR